MWETLHYHNTPIEYRYVLLWNSHVGKTESCYLVYFIASKMTSARLVWAFTPSDIDSILTTPAAMSAKGKATCGETYGA
jgi:hypothetical protein